MTEYLPPHLEVLYTRFESSLRTLAANTSAFAQRSFQAGQPIEQVDEALLERVSAAPGASAAMVDAAARVRSGICSWSEIVNSSWPPPEIHELAALGVPFVFTRPDTSAPNAPSRPTVDWDDDEDRPPRSWLTNEW
ncbi:hypothetical protein G4X40_21105 [Rhodococcus sp. D2-41]|uniref:hypothetical protein n=1 Tax=Speluncibacter jeojiensis TaxID=2710754 RepID=UPI00240EC2D3|nr:hypothetical protein [Rhodococcus sp. D2-41]MDG3012643.1 hypothetical protein [Rhodococcus sp. D2-41]